MADTISLDDGQSPILSLLQQAVFQTDMFKYIKGVDTIINSLDKNMRKLTNADEMQRYIHVEIYGVQDDPNNPTKESIEREKFMRRLRMMSKINELPETAIEYYGQDFKTHPEFHFSQDFDNKMKDIEIRLNKFTGSCLKELAKGDEFEI